MRRAAPAVVASILPGSLAASIGLTPGDRIIRINGRAPRDYIEYRYLIAEEHVSLTWQETQGRPRRARIEKTPDEDLGITFTSDVFDGIITCGNRCAFCFVSQLPGGLRPALYLRDDDYRLSFLHGNFITLTNLTAADRARIMRDHLSPLYVSVHATDPAIRRVLFGREAPDPLREMRRLGQHGIRFHTQLVVCPGLNDGAALDQTVNDLASLHPVVQSIGVVPVGLTKHRRGGTKVRRVTAAGASRLMDAVQQWQAEFHHLLGTRLVFAADELYLLSGAPLPTTREYEDFPQLGNGIGCARQFLTAIQRVRPPAVRSPLLVALVTGEMAAPLVQKLAAALSGRGVQAETVVVPNRLFGRSVTTAGLLAGKDIMAVLRRGQRFDVIIVPGTAVREGAGFLDGVRLEDMASAVGAPVIAAATPGEVAKLLRATAGHR